MKILSWLGFAAMICLLAVLAPARAWALGEEQVGNEPLSAANYVKWPGLAEVVNDRARAYYFWVNGNENFYYVGSVAELNAALKNFAAAELKEHEVLLRPDTGTVQSFQGDNKFTFNWHLQIMDGIAGHLTTLEKGDQVWNKHPRLTIHVSGDVALDKLDIPKGVKLLTVSDLSARARQGIESKDKTVRGWCAGVIADLNPRDAENQAALEKLLADEDDWVRLNAAGSIPLFGTKAKSALPALKGCLERKDEGLKTRAQKAIETIESAQEDAAADRAHAETMERIKKFVADHKANP
ncbi:MAG TPA: HEAT repeat domain-containing protein [Pirellulaceae bacterium]|nr:HEAT repeat domain-containing protein [Pirellulaceae bacterium]